MFQTYSSRGDDQLGLTLLGAHQGGELLANTLEDAQSVVLGKSLEEVLDGLILLSANLVLELGNDLGLVGEAESGSDKDLLELGVALEEGGQALEGLGRAVEGLGLDGGSVLDTRA